MVKLILILTIFCCHFLQAQVKEVVVPLSDEDKLYFDSLKEVYTGFGAVDVNLLPNAIVQNVDTLTFIVKVLGSEWYKAGIRFHSDGSLIKYTVYVNANGKIDVLSILFDKRFTDSEKSLMLQVASQVIDKFRYNPKPNVKLNMSTHTYLKNP